MTIWLHRLAVPVRHLQRIPQAKVGGNAVGVDLRNRVGKCNDFVKVLLLDQLDHQSIERTVVHAVKIGRCLQPDRLCLPVARSALLHRVAQKIRNGGKRGCMGAIEESDIN